MSCRWSLDTYWTGFWAINLNYSNFKHPIHQFFDKQQEISCHLSLFWISALCSRIYNGLVNYWRFFLLLKINWQFSFPLNTLMIGTKIVSIERRTLQLLVDITFIGRFISLWIVNFRKRNSFIKDNIKKSYYKIIMNICTTHFP